LSRGVEWDRGSEQHYGCDGGGDDECEYFPSAADCGCLGRWCDVAWVCCERLGGFVVKRVSDGAWMLAEPRRV
jgi:hypothetical protein